MPAARQAFQQDVRSADKSGDDREAARAGVGGYGDSGENYDISINLEDFVGDPEFLDPAMASQMPLSGIAVQEADSLLIVDCLYEMTTALQADTCATSSFKIAVDSLSFILVEPLNSANAPKRANEHS